MPGLASTLDLPGTRRTEITSVAHPCPTQPTALLPLNTRGVLSGIVQTPIGRLRFALTTIQRAEQITDRLILTDQDTPLQAGRTPLQTVQLIWTPQDHATALPIHATRRDGRPLTDAQRRVLNATRHACAAALYTPQAQANLRLAHLERQLTDARHHEAVQAERCAHWARLVATHGGVA